MQERAGDLKRRRVESLDVLRGLVVAGMIVVNNPGDWSAVFPPLMHAFWTGLTLADLVFPAFILVMGIAMPIAFARRREAGASTRKTSQAHRPVASPSSSRSASALNAVSSWPNCVAAAVARRPSAHRVRVPRGRVVVLRVRPSRWLVVAAALLSATGRCSRSCPLAINRRARSLPTTISLATSTRSCSAVMPWPFRSNRRGCSGPCRRRRPPSSAPRPANSSGSRAATQLSCVRSRYPAARLSRSGSHGRASCRSASRSGPDRSCS